MAISIENPHDPRLADYADLRAPRRADWFVVEGTLAVERLLASPYQARSIVVSPAGFDRLGKALDACPAPVYVVELDALRRLVGFDLHRGVLASAWRRPLADLDAILQTARRLVVLEGINDLENLGAIARSARALGADALVLDPTCADPFNRRSVRVSVGELLHLAVARATAWPTAIADLRAAGFEVWALSPRADAVAIGDRPPPSRLALLAGAEGPGLTSAARDAATATVRIPIRDDVDSLNVAHAVSIALALTTELPA